MATSYLFVMGAGSGVGKSTVCSSILAQLLSAGYAPEHLAYIKPVTQCTAKQPVADFCRRTGIAYRDIGSLVFRKGFTKNFIDHQMPGPNALLSEVLASLLAIGKDKAVVIIDGVGDPAVGGVVGVSNVDIAVSLPCRVIFVGRPGIGAAIDNTVLCVSFIQAKGLKNIGIVYNNVPSASLEEMTVYVSKRLPECLPDITLLGFVPKQPANSKDNMEQWLATYLDTNALFYNWMGLPDARMLW